MALFYVSDMISSTATIFLLQVTLGLAQHGIENMNSPASSTSEDSNIQHQNYMFSQPPVGSSCPFSSQTPNNFGGQTETHTNPSCPFSQQYQNSQQSENQSPQMYQQGPAAQLPITGNTLANQYTGPAISVPNPSPIMINPGQMSQFPNNVAFMPSYYPGYFPGNHMGHFGQFPFPPNFTPVFPPTYQRPIQANFQQTSEHRSSEHASQPEGHVNGEPSEVNSPSHPDINLHSESSQTEHPGNKRSLTNFCPNMYPFQSPYGMPYMPQTGPQQPTGNEGQSYQSNDSSDSNASQSQTQSSDTPTVVSSSGGTGSDLPPQVKEFMEMIPQILNCQDSGMPGASPSRYARYINGASAPMRRMRFLPRHHHYYY